MNKRIFISTKNFALVSERCYTILLEEGKIARPTGANRERILKTASAWFHKENDEIMTHDKKERMINIFAKKIAVCEYFNSIK